MNGGSVCMPALKLIISQLFTKAQLTLDDDGAVARGCALFVSQLHFHPILCNQTGMKIEKSGILHFMSEIVHLDRTTCWVID